MTIQDIILDIDDVLGDLVTPWITIYNHEYNDNLSKNDIIEWDMTKFVKPECGIKIYDILKMPNIYDSVKVLDGALEGVNFLRERGKKITFVTARDLLSNKFLWLQKNGFTDNIEELVIAKDKNRVKGDIIIDDNFDNVNNYDGIGILVNQPWNTKYVFPDRYNSQHNYSRRVNNWNEIIELFGK